MHISNGSGSKEQPYLGGAGVVRADIGNAEAVAIVFRQPGYPATHCVADHHLFNERD
jgi:hypothetical protein